MVQHSQERHSSHQQKQQTPTPPTATREQTTAETATQIPQPVGNNVTPASNDVLRLQQSIGNQATARLIQSQQQEALSRQAQPAPAQTFGNSDPRGLISGLHPTLQSKIHTLIANAHKRGLNIQVFEGLRSIERQNALYSQGRDAQGNVVDKSKIVTNVKGGSSYHNYGVAVDVVFHGNQPWGEQHDWEGLGKSGEEAGLEWGGRWTSFVDRPHFQIPGLTIAQMKAWHAAGGLENVWKNVSGNGAGAEAQQKPGQTPVAPTATTGTAIGTATVTANGLNVRQGAGAKHAVLGVLSKGAQVQVIRREGSWLNITYQGKSGYIHADYATFTAAPTQIGTATVTSNGLNVRQGAGTKHAVLGVLSKGVRVPVIRREGSWLNITYQGKSGFIHADYVTFTPTPTATPTPATPTPAPQTQPTPGGQTATPTTQPPQSNTAPPAANTPLSYDTHGTQYFDVANQITSIMEGGATSGKYDALTTVADGGIISYGKHQATLAAGSLTSILSAYVAASQSSNAQIISTYMDRVRAKDASLKNDSKFLNTLRAAAAEKEMQTAQDMVFRQGYWNPAVTAAQNQGISSPLGYAMLYDTKIQGGMENCLEKARAKCGGGVGARVGNKVITETEFLKVFNDEREARLEALAQSAESKNELTRARALRGSKYRCVAFRQLLEAGNLNVSGPEGKVEITGPGSKKYAITGFNSGQATAPAGQGTATADTAIAQGVVTASTLNVRQGPNASGTALGQLRQGAKVEITGQSGSWLRINYNGRPAYVHGDYIRLQQQGQAQQQEKTLDEAAAAHIQITFGKNANSSVISPYTLNVLRATLNEAGETSAIITSTVRTPEDQARIMYNNIVTYGVQHQKNLYGAAGDAVIDVYAAQKSAGANESATRTAMVNKINELGPGSISRHCSDPAKLQVVDIAPSSIQNKTKFVQALQAALEAKRISKYILPPADPAYHIEIPQ